MMKFLHLSPVLFPRLPWVLNPGVTVPGWQDVACALYVDATAHARKDTVEKLCFRLAAGCSGDVAQLANAVGTAC